MAHTETISAAPELKFRNLTAARDAYACADSSRRADLSREAHSLLTKDPGSPALKPTSTWSPWAADAEAGHNEELAHRGLTLLLRAAVDGVMLSLLVLSLGDAAQWPMRLTLTLNAVILLCWAAYAACREALEIITYESYYKRERARESWELDNFPEGEVEEMVQLYCKRGLPESAARSVVGAMATSPEFFVDVMMLEELQMSPPATVSAASAAARICAGSLVCGGAIPLVACLLDRVAMGAAAAHPFLVAVAIAALGYLGSVRASITHQGRKRLALQTLGLSLPVLVVARVAGGLLAGIPTAGAGGGY